jgi:hypothetical protein
MHSASTFLAKLIDKDFFYYKCHISNRNILPFVPARGMSTTLFTGFFFFFFIAGLATSAKYENSKIKLREK